MDLWRTPPFDVFMDLLGFHVDLWGGGMGSMFSIGGEQ